MKKSLVKLIVYIAVSSIVVLVVVIANNVLDRDSLLDRISKWPDLQVNTLDGEKISTTEIMGDKSMMLYYYNTECI